MKCKLDVRRPMAARILCKDTRQLYSPTGAAIDKISDLPGTGPPLLLESRVDLEYDAPKPDARLTELTKCSIFDRKPCERLSCTHCFWLQAGHTCTKPLYRASALRCRQYFAIAHQWVSHDIFVPENVNSWTLAYMCEHSTKTTNRKCWIYVFCSA